MQLCKSHIFFKVLVYAELFRKTFMEIIVWKISQIEHGIEELLYYQDTDLGYVCTVTFIL